MTTEQELEREKAKTEGARVSYEFMKRHLTDFDQSAESAKKIQDYLVEHDLDFSELSLEKAFAELTKRGIRFTTAADTPAAAVVPAPPIVPVEESLPEVPRYMDNIRSSKDIRDLAHETFTKWRRGPDRDAFFKRLEFIKQRGL
jgi:hypothetical protein